MDKAELIQILVAAALTQVERIVLTMTVEQREKREQAILACTKAVYDIDPNEIFCNITVDISCWPPTRANSTVAIQCFEHDGTNPNHKARRHCSENGIWSRINFTDCFILDPVVEPDRIQIRRNVIKQMFDIGYPITCVTLLMAIAVLFYFKTLRCLRNYIHCNLMLAMLISDIKYLLLSYTGVNIAKESYHGCRIFVFFMTIFNTAVFFWMFVEGVYLLTVVLWTYQAHKIRLWQFLLFAWGTPVILTSIYAVLMAFYDTENTCWLPTYMEQHAINPYTVIAIAIAIVLAINLLIVVYVVWTLCHKLRGNTSVEIQQVRKASWAILVLLPILGLHFLVTYAFESVSPAIEVYFYYIRNGIQAVQGILVALFYCFLNGEVHTAFRQKLAVCLEHRSNKASLSQNLSGKKSGHSGIRSSFDNKDISPTLYDKTEIPQLSMTPTGMRQTPLAKIESSV